MKRFYNLTALLTLILVSGSLSAQTLEKKVLFIGIDGVRTDALQSASTPTIDSLMTTGLYTFGSWHLGITVSGPSWSDMLTGVWESKHGVTSNSYTGSHYNDYPYFVTRAKEKNPSLKAVQITSWGPMSYNVYNDGWDSKIVVPSDDACESAAVLQLADPDLDILFVHIDDCDAQGHSNGFHPSISPYMNQLEYVDAQVKDIVDAVMARPTYSSEDWLILLTTDHGGIGLGHGGNTNDERAIWWVASGPAAPNAEIIGSDPGSYQTGGVDTVAMKNTPVLVDIAVTALDHILPGTDPEAEVAWDLDGKSWLDFGVYVEEENGNEDAFIAYPNPNNGRFKAVFNTNEAANYKLIDVTGKVVKSATLPASTTRAEVEFDLTGFEAGIYMLTFESNGVRSTRRIIVR